ncbi:MAG: hypothetical protein E7677_02150 [Ruminococcaceae bacterium]|nr:hypothetical protein [Oscillospiraceae bacterium]
MQIDKKALEGLLALNDKQLASIINRLIAESGIDPKEFNIDPSSASSIRSAIAGADEAELRRIVEQYEANKKGRGLK